MLAPHFTLTGPELNQLRKARTSVAVSDAVFRIEGAGTITCLQGLLTNDVARLATGSAAWGAFLTAKGMIVADAWVIRDHTAAWVVVPATARDTMQQLFARTMPPRLAKVTDRTGEVHAIWLCGAVPTAIDTDTVAHPDGAAPFASLLLTSDPTAAAASLTGQGFVPVPESRADVLKVLAGWPTLGREIDERTLPQEVRFDELGGVKYDKGCYTGQETVARLHFRGHANRALRGMRWAPGEGPTDPQVTDGDKVVGTIRTVVNLGDEVVALAVLRREVAAGDIVLAGTGEGVVTELPFDLGGSVVA